MCVQQFVGEIAERVYVELVQRVGVDFVVWELGDWLVERDVAQYVAGLVDRCVTRAGLRWLRDGV